MDFLWLRKLNFHQLERKKKHSGTLYSITTNIRGFFSYYYYYYYYYISFKKIFCCTWRKDHRRILVTRSRATRSLESSHEDCASARQTRLGPGTWWMQLRNQLHMMTGVFFFFFFFFFGWGGAFNIYELFVMEKI